MNGEAGMRAQALEPTNHYALRHLHINMEIQGRWPALDILHILYNLIFITRLSIFFTAEETKAQQD